MTIAHGAVLEAIGQPLVLREIALPQLAAGETLVEVIACTLCGSDLHSLHGRRQIALPTILGHEILGRLCAFGPGTSQIDAAGVPLAIGDRVTWSIVASCGSCFFCTRDLPQKCLRQTKYGHEALAPGRELSGGLASHCLLMPGTALFRIPEAVPDAVACPANCATATVAAALEPLKPVAGKTVLVLGAGMLGVTALAWVAALGAANVICCDISSERLAIAKQFGATHTCMTEELAATVNALTEGRGVDAALELTGSPEAFEAALPLVRIGGSVILVGSVFPSRPVPLLLEQVVRRCLTLRGIHNYAPRHLAAALQFLAAQPRGRFEALVGPWQELAAINEVLEMKLPAPALRLGVRPG